MYQKKQRINVEIVDLAENDMWFGRLEDGMGVFVRGPATIGDVVDAEIIKVKKKYLESKLHTIISPSPERILPVCDHFGVCGGCKFQHIEYSEQLRLKKKKIRDALSHIGRMDDVVVEDPLRPDAILNYRNKVEFSFSDRRYLSEHELAGNALAVAKPVDFALGFHAPRVYSKIVDIDRCHIATEEMNVVLEKVKSFCRDEKLPVYTTRTHEGLLRHLIIRQGFNTQELMVNVVTHHFNQELMDGLLLVLKEALGEKLTTFVNNITTRKGEVSLGEEEVVIYGPGYILERLGDYQFKISANSFFQTNTLQAEKIIKAIRNLGQFTTSDRVFDFYCGTGSISLNIAGQCASVVGIDNAESAIDDAIENAAINQITNCHFQRHDLNKPHDLLIDLAESGPPNVVITDPPRAGMHHKMTNYLLELAPDRIVYVSCNPASLARDAAILCASGGYQIRHVQPIDMFPFTNHIETIVLLRK